jgi:hypothetical protein
MSYAKIINKVKSTLSDNDKIRALIAFFNTSENPINQDEKEIINYIVDSLFLTNKYSLKLGKIINSLSYRTNSDNYKKVKYFLTTLIDKKACINFNQIDKSSFSTGANIFILLNYIAEFNSSKLLNESMIEIFKKCLSWINETSDINNLYYGHKKTPLINYFIMRENIFYFAPLIFHITTEYEKYNLDLMKRSNEFHRDLFFYQKDDEEQLIELRRKIILAWSEKDFKQKFQYSLKTKGKGDNAELILYYCDEKTILMAIENRPDIFKEKNFDPLVILENENISLSNKIFLLDKLADRKIPVMTTTVYYGLLALDSAKNKQKQLLDFCFSHLNVNLSKENKAGENIFYSISPDHDLTYFKKYIKKNKITIKPNHLGYYPLHYLNLDIYDTSKEENVLEKLNFLIDSGNDINYQNKKGNTVLSLALCINNPQYFIQALIKKNADLTLKNKYGKSSYDYFLKYKAHFKLDSDNNFVIYVEKLYLEQLLNHSMQDKQINTKIKV